MGFSSNEYQKTQTNADGKTAGEAFRSYPNNFLYSGHIYSGSLSAGGVYAHYWSSTTSGNCASTLSVNDDYVSPANGCSYIKRDGLSIRCILKQQ